MKNNPALNRLVALMLLFVFAISSAPKAFFHDLIADHQDSAGCTIDHSNVVLHNHVENCDFNDLVVPLIFLPLKNTGFACKAFFPERVFADQHSYLFPTYRFHKDNRGPPVHG